ncbi:MAG: hypothetical protein ACK5MZ_00680, partial [Aestuariibaculum sp.]
NKKSKLFNQRKNKSFNYRSRFSEESQEGEDLEALKNSEDTSFISKWRDERASNRKVKAALPIRTLIIILVLLLLCMYILETKYK